MSETGGAVEAESPAARAAHVRAELECACCDNEDTLTRICQKIERINAMSARRTAAAQRMQTHRTVAIALMLAAFVVLYARAMQLK